MLRPGDLIYLISRWKSASVRPEEAATLAQTDREHLAAAAYRRYQNALKTCRRTRLRRHAALHRRTLRQLPQGAKGRGRPVRSSAGRRVSRHQRQPVSHRQGPGRGPSQSVRGRRRRSVDLRLARRRGCPYSSLQERLARGQSRAARSELSLHARNRRMGQPADRLQQAAARQSASGHVQRRAAAHLATRRRDEGGRDRRRRHCRSNSRKEATPQGFRHPLPHERAAPRIRDGTAPEENPLRA